VQKEAIQKLLNIFRSDEFFAMLFFAIKHSQRRYITPYL